MAGNKRKRVANAAQDDAQAKKQKQKQKQGVGAAPISPPVTHKPLHAKKHKGKPKSKRPVKKAAPAVVPIATTANSNWLAMKTKIQQKDTKYSGSSEKKHDLDVGMHKQKVKDQKLAKKKQSKTAEWIDNSRILAMDCEMVGVGLSGKQSVLARCSLVDYDGRVVYDKTVRPVEKVTGTSYTLEKLNLDELCG